MRGTAFIYMAFGSEMSYKQCAFSVLTLIDSNKSEGSIFVVTDNEAAIASKIGLNEGVQYEVLSSSKFKEMRGDIDFVHRIKIATIELISKKHTDFERYVYLDSDTLVCGDLGSIINQISPNVSLTHKHEFKFLDTELYPENDQSRELLKYIQKSQLSIEVNKERIAVHDRFSSWNAGVLGIHASNMTLLSSVYELTSLFYKKTSHHASEQFAFSFVLESRTRLITCEHEILHYWPKVTKEIADEFFTSFFKMNKRQSLDAGRVNRSRKELEKLFNTHVYFYQDKAIKAFTSGNFFEGLTWSIKSLIKNPFRRPKFLLDVMYYIKNYSLRLIKSQV